jgi:hypothetical protein
MNFKKVFGVLFLVFRVWPSVPQHQEQNTKYETPNTKHPTRNTQHETPIA